MKKLPVEEPERSEPPAPSPDDLLVGIVRCNVCERRTEMESTWRNVPGSCALHKDVCDDCLADALVPLVEKIGDFLRCPVADCEHIVSPVHDDYSSDETKHAMTTLEEHFATAYRCHFIGVAAFFLFARARDHWWDEEKSLEPSSAPFVSVRVRLSIAGGLLDRVNWFLRLNGGTGTSPT